MVTDTQKPGTSEMLTVTVAKRKKTKKTTGTELDLGSEEEIEDVIVTEDERGTRDDVTKKMKIEQLNEC